MFAVAVFFIVLCVFACLLHSYRQEILSTVDAIEIHRRIDGVTDINQIIERLEEFFREKKICVLGFYFRDRTQKALWEKYNPNKIKLLEDSPAVQAFLSLKPYNLNGASKAGKGAKGSGRDIWHVPLQMNGTVPCWIRRGCDKQSCECFRKDVTTCWISSGKSRGEMFEGGSGNIRCISCSCFLPVGVFKIRGEDMSAVKRLLKGCAGRVRGAVMCRRAEHMVAWDPLTKLLNRRGLLGHLDSQCLIAAQYNQPLSLCMLSMDPFSDSCADKPADRLLVQLAEIIENYVSASDIVARYQEDIFCIIFPLTDKDSAIKAVEKMRKTISEGYITNTKVPISLSAGVAGFPDDARECTGQLHLKALIALKEAQSVGSRVVGYTPD